MLTPERIRELWENYSPTKGIESFARSVEAEVRKDDEALIRQMLEAAIAIYPHLSGLAVASDEALSLLQQQISVIAAARARLEKAP